MANDFEQMLKDLFGDSLNKITQFSSEQKDRFQARLQEFARDAVKEELAKLHAEVADLHARVAELEKERVQDAAELV